MSEAALKSRVLEAHRAVNAAATDARRAAGMAVRRWLELGNTLLALRRFHRHGTWQKTLIDLLGHASLSRAEKAMRLAQDLEGAPPEVVDELALHSLSRCMESAREWRSGKRPAATRGTPRRKATKRGRDHRSLPDGSTQQFLALLGELEGRTVITGLVGGQMRVLWADTPGPALWEVLEPGRLKEPGFLDALGAERLGEREGRVLAAVPRHAVCPQLGRIGQVALVRLLHGPDDAEVAALTTVERPPGWQREFYATGLLWSTLETGLKQALDAKGGWPTGETSERSAAA